MQKSEKTKEQSLRCLKTDQRTDRRTDRQGQLLRTPSGKPKVQNGILSPELGMKRKVLSISLTKPLKTSVEETSIKTTRYCHNAVTTFICRSDQKVWMGILRPLLGWKIWEIFLGIWNKLPQLIYMLIHNSSWSSLCLTSMMGDRPQAKVLYFTWKNISSHIL